MQPVFRLLSMLLQLDWCYESHLSRIDMTTVEYAANAVNKNVNYPHDSSHISLLHPDRRNQDGLHSLALLYRVLSIQRSRMDAATIKRTKSRRTTEMNSLYAYSHTHTSVQTQCNLSQWITSTLHFASIELLHSTFIYPMTYCQQLAKGKKRNVNPLFHIFK